MAPESLAGSAPHAPHPGSRRAVTRLPDNNNNNNNGNHCMPRILLAPLAPLRVRPPQAAFRLSCPRCRRPPATACPSV